MAEPKDVTFELNVFGDDPKSHLKLTGPGTPPLEFVVAAFKRLDDAQALWNQTRGYQEPPQDGADAPSAPKPASRPRSSSTTIRDPDSAATSKQAGMIRGLCGKVDSRVVLSILEPYNDADGKYNQEGYYIPEWDFLNSLTKGEASGIIEALKDT